MMAEEIKKEEKVETVEAPVEQNEETKEETKLAAVNEKTDLPSVQDGVQEFIAEPLGARTMWNDPKLMQQSLLLAKTLAGANMVPNGYKNQPGNCLIAIDYSHRMNVSPLTVMSMLDIIQGNPGWRGQAAIALVNNCGRFEPIEFEETSDGKGNFSCVAFAKEKKTGKIFYSTKVDNVLAKECGWLDKNGTYWKKIPEQMARYRAAAFFARVYCPEALMGLYTADEQRDITGNYSDSNEIKKFEIRR